MEQNLSRAYSEVYSFLNAVGDEYKNKIPNKVLKKFELQRDKNFNPVFHREQILTENDISKEALTIIAALNIKYWCESEEEKIRLLKAYAENSKR